MNSTIIVSVIGPDRPGIVDDLSSLIIDNGGNWLESRMSNLAGQFAGILMVECPAQKYADLCSALEAFEGGGLKIQLAPGKDDAGHEPVGRADIELEITGPDHPGIIHDIAHFLAERDISIAEMDSHCEEGAMSGGYVFHSKIAASIPHSLDIGEVEDSLDDLSGALNVDIVLDDKKGKRTRI